MDGKQKLVASNGNGTTASATHPSSSHAHSTTTSRSTPRPSNGVAAVTAPLDDKCAGCGEDLKDGQALMALDKQYHVWCFKCRSCQVLLHGEYMGKDGQPYCERDYQKEFGVKCTYCRRFISGKVLQVCTINNPTN